MPFGKHKGTKISELPTDYMEWAVGDNGLDPEKSDKWIAAMQRQLEIRKGAAAKGRPVESEPTHPLGGKEMLDNLVCAYDYLSHALGRLGYPTSEPHFIEPIQRMAVTVGIRAFDEGVNLRAAVGKTLSDMHKADDGDLPF